MTTYTGGSRLEPIEGTPISEIIEANITPKTSIYLLPTHVSRFSYRLRRDV